MREYRAHIGRVAYHVGLLLLLMLLFSNSFLIVSKAEEGPYVNVIILNSYNDSFNWTHDQKDGIVKTIRSSGKNISISIENMDWKNYNSKDNWDRLYEYYLYKYKDKNIDLVITTDDAALDFALEYRALMFSDAPIVFCGVNFEGIKTLVRDQSNVTGVAEEINPIETLELALRVNPLIKEIYLLFDNSESGLSTGQLMNETIKDFNPNIEVINWNDLSFDEMLEEVEELKPSSIIYITTYSSDVNNTKYDIDYVVRQVSQLSSVPVYGLYDFSLGQGIIGGRMLSGSLQGEYAGHIANRILAGEDIKDIPILYTNTTKTGFDHDQLVRYDIPLSILPHGSEIINKPFSFYHTYKQLVLTVVAIFILIVVFVLILLFYIRKLRGVKRDLHIKNEKLIVSDEKTRKQYEEILQINEKIRLRDEKLRHLAYHDALTGLPNKLSLFEYMDRANPASGKALFFIDIDNFKFINDTLGHNYGDKLLKNISNEICKLIQNDGTLYRLSGDEFLILYDNVSDIEEVETIAKKLLEDFYKDGSNKNIDMRVTFSIGISIYPTHGNGLDDLIKYADIAMYSAKKQGKNRFIIYNETLNESFLERVTIEKHIPKGLENEEFELYFQPQLEIKSNKIIGFEALLRWNSPDIGPIAPNKIIEVAEETHFIIPLGRWILYTACEFLKLTKEKGYAGLTMSINISILQLLQDDFVNQVLDALRVNDLSPEDIVLEITETILMESFDEVIDKLSLLRERNIHIALDDFGKGYSSLSYLKRLPITIMKIDKLFIDDILVGDDAFLSYVIALGKELGVTIVAEGVEFESQLNNLKQHNCDIIQGCLFSRPQPKEYILDFLARSENMLDL